MTEGAVVAVEEVPATEDAVAGRGETKRSGSCKRGSNSCRPGSGAPRDEEYCWRETGGCGLGAAAGWMMGWYEMGGSAVLIGSERSKSLPAAAVRAFGGGGIDRSYSPGPGRA